MENDIKRRFYPKNPLGIIALFVFFIEAISTISLKFALENQSEYVGHIVWLVILFPSIVVLFFFLTLWFKRESFYSPGDFRDDASFVTLINKVKSLEVKQEAFQLDPNSSFDDIFKTIKKLIESNEIYNAIQLGRAPLKVSRYETSAKIFAYLKDKVSASHELYSKILANLAYSSIGLKNYEEAINLLLEVRKRRGDERFYVWQAVALAYSYFKIGNQTEHEKWIEHAKKRKEEYSDNLRLMIRLYPEIKDGLESQ